MAGMGDEVGEVRAVRQMAGGRSGRVEHDDHRAWLQLLLDAGGDLADMRVGNGEHDDVGAVERLLDRNGVDAEPVLEPLAACLAHLDVAHLVWRTAKVRGQAIAHFAAGAEQRDFRHILHSSHGPPLTSRSGIMSIMLSRKRDRPLFGVVDSRQSDAPRGPCPQRPQRSRETGEHRSERANVRKWSAKQSDLCECRQVGDQTFRLCGLERGQRRQHASIIFVRREALPGPT